MEERSCPTTMDSPWERELEQMPSVDDFHTVAVHLQTAGGRQPHPDFLAAVPL